MTASTSWSALDTLLILNFATRLLSLDLGLEIVFERALEAFSDFSANGEAALFLLDSDRKAVRLEGTFVGLKYRSWKRSFPLEGTPMQDVMRNRRYGRYPVATDGDFPLPTFAPHPEGRECLCLPLFRADADVIGMVAIEQRSGQIRRTEDIQILIILATVTAISIENARLFRQATHDGLTGLYVRHFFDLRLKEELSRLKRYGGGLALMLSDVDDFKAINDRFGHRRGDAVLRELAAIFKSHVRNDVDIICRYGGDEFLTLMTAADLEEALKVAERIHQACLSHGFRYRGTDARVTISSGIAVAASPSLPAAEALLERADAALYEAKRRGKNQIVTG